MKTALVLVFLWFPCYTYGQEALLQYLTLPKELKKNANSVVRLESTVVEINAYNDMAVKHKRIVTVLNENGDKDVDAFLGYDEEDRIDHLEANVYDAFGQQQKRYKKRDFEDQSAVSGGTLYSESRVKFLRHTPTSYP